MEDEHYLLSRHAQANSESKLTDVEDIEKVVGSEGKAHAANKGHLRASPNPR